MTRQDDLDALDDLLQGVRRLLQRPGYRRRFLAELAVPVSPGTLRVVRAVKRLDVDEPSMGDVAGMLAVDPSTATRLADQAAAEGYLERRPSSRDQRRTMVALTPAGDALLEQADKVRRRLLADVMTSWSDDDLHVLTHLLGRLTADLDRLERP